MEKKGVTGKKMIALPDLKRTLCDLKGGKSNGIPSKRGAIGKTNQESRRGWVQRNGRRQREDPSER